MCEGCGAPLQIADIQCSYCLRATGVMPQRIEVTKIDSRGKEFIDAVQSGTMSPNDARRTRA